MRNVSELLRILNSVLGPSRHSKADNEESFKCPFCNHRKLKLQVSIDRGVWHCWVCNSRGKSLYSLVKKANADSHTIKLVSDLTRDPEYITYRKKDKNDKEIPILRLPKEFKSLLKFEDSIEFRNALHYAKLRGITREDVIKHNIGYCAEGRYSNRLIVPSYDDSASLNYFVARAYYKDDPIAYKNPPAERDTILFDLHINWNEPITLVEGVFDALAIKSNAIPLLGKFISNSLHSKIMGNRVSRINIALDLDGRADALKIAKKYMSQGISVRLLDIQGKDPSELGFSGILETDSIEMGFETLLKQRIAYEL